MRQPISDLVLDATERLLARFGYNKMTVDDIAREAGVSKRAIYMHFSGKEEVALRSIDRVVARLIQHQQEIISRAISPSEKVRELLIKRVLFRFDSVQDYYWGFDEMFAALRPAYLARREIYFAQETELLRTALEEGQATGEFARDIAAATAQTLLLATNALLPYSLSARELGRREEVEARITALADLMLDGLRRRT